jgi:hypothetical protein
MTIAFSEKFNSWTTRYSFEPTCYSDTGNKMVSFDDNGAVWLHDSNDERCSFYGSQGGASLELVSNQDPSAIKMFKSLSVETNGTGWSGKVYTNDEYSGNEKQEGDILESFFKNKEGFKYADMPRSKVNSSNVVVVGPSLDFPAPTVNYSPLHFLIEDSISSQGLSSVGGFIIGADGSVLETFDFDIPSRVYGSIQVNNPLLYKKPDGEIQELPGVKVVGYGDDFVRLSILVNQEDVPYPFEALGNTFYFPQLNTTLGDALYFTDTGGGEGVTIIAMSGNATMFVSYNSEVEGDQIRGPYARIKLDTSTTEPFELHAINVEYEFSKLDKRLTQNS